MKSTKHLLILPLLALMTGPAIAAATKEEGGNRAHCDIHRLSKKEPIIGRVTTGEKLHCSLYLTPKTKEAILGGGGTAAAAVACTALSASIVAAGAGPEDVIADALAVAAEGVCVAAVETAVVVAAESCKGGFDLNVDGKASIGPPPKGHVAIHGHACR